MVDVLINDLKCRAKEVYEGINILLNSENYEVVKRKLVFEIKDDQEINGRSWCTNEEDHIEINIGVIKIYTEYFLKVTNYLNECFYKLLTGIDDEKQLKDFMYEGLIFNDKGVKIITSKNFAEDRTKLMEIFVSRFILLHEYGHIFDGHCNYLSDFYGGNDFIKMRYEDEEGVFDDEQKRKLDTRTLEMDADMFATSQSIYHLVFLYLNFDEQVQCIGMKPIELFYWWAFAIRSQFLVCEDRFADTYKYSERMSHLPSNARWDMIANTVETIIHKCFNSEVMDINTIEKLFFDGVLDAEKIFNEIKCSKYNWINELSGNVKYSYYKKEVNEHWKVLKEQLIKYSRFPLAD